MASCSSDPETNVKQCHTCRRKRWTCDARKPRCMRCTQNGISCLGYGDQAYVWVRPHLSSTRRRKRKVGRPRIALMVAHDEDEDEDTGGSRQVQRSKEIGSHLGQVAPYNESIWNNIAPVNYYEEQLSLQILSYWDDIIIPGITIAHGLARPKHFGFSHWRQIPPVGMDMLITSALSHQSIQLELNSRKIRSPGRTVGFGYEPITTSSLHLAQCNGPLVGLVYKYHQRVFKALGEMLNAASEAFLDMVLISIAGLMRIEVQQSPFNACLMHLDGARSVILQQGGVTALATRDLKTCHLPLRAFIVVDVIGAMLIPAHHLEEELISSQLEYMPHIKSIFTGDRSFEWPCPSQLLGLVIAINYCRMTSGRMLASAKDIDDRSAQILKNAMSFDAVSAGTQQLEEQRLRSACAHSNPKDGSMVSYQSDLLCTCQDITRIYQYAVTLYCLRTLYQDRGLPIPATVWLDLPDTTVFSSETTVNTELLHGRVLRRLMDSLKAFRSGSTARWPNKLLTWPLWVAGFVLDHNDADAEASRLFINEYLYDLGCELGSLGPVGAAATLETVWKQTIGDGMASKWTWDQRLALMGNSGFFFL